MKFTLIHLHLTHTPCPPTNITLTRVIPITNSILHNTHTLPTNTPHPESPPPRPTAITYRSWAYVSPVTDHHGHQSSLGQSGEGVADEQHLDVQKTSDGYQQSFSEVGQRYVSAYSISIACNSIIVYAI